MLLDAMERYRPREITTTLVRAAGSVPAIVLTGMRQTGKTTLLRLDPAFAKWCYVSLDDFAELEMAKSRPDELLARAQHLIVDEVQRAPDLLLAAKRAIDRDRRPGRFIFSGSASFSLLSSVSESLAGRALYLPLLPLSRREIAGTTAVEPWIKRFHAEGAEPRLPDAPAAVAEVMPRDVFLGGLPPVCLGEAADPVLWFQGFEQTWLERDLRALAQVADLISFRHLLRLAALRTGQILKQSELARGAKMTAAVTTRYLSLLETSFVIDRLPPFLGNRASRVIRSPKVYLRDSGLAAHLAGVGEADLGRDDPLRGALFETYVYQNLSANLFNGWTGATLSYWNVQGRHEVDFVIEAGRDVMAIEVKAAARWEKRDLVGLSAFLAATPRCRAAILAYNGTEAVSLGERLWAVPISLLLS